MRTTIAAVAAATVLAAGFGAGAEASPVYASDVYVDAGLNQDTGNAQRFGPDNALGAANGDFYSLGLGGLAFFTFGGDILGAGTVVEVTFNCTVTTSGTCSYDETAALYGVKNPFPLVADGTIGGVQNYDLTGLLGAAGTTLLAEIPNGAAQGGGFAYTTGGEAYAGLLLVDTSRPASGRDGFDVASISATPAPVPVPPAAALLFGALGGLGLVKRRKA